MSRDHWNLMPANHPSKCTIINGTLTIAMTASVGMITAISRFHCSCRHTLRSRSRAVGSSAHNAMGAANSSG